MTPGADEIEKFADKIADYMGTRTTPWLNAAEMREAVHEALRLTFTEAVDDPDNPRLLAAVRFPSRVSLPEHHTTEGQPD